MRDKLKKEEFFRNSLLFTEDCISEFEKIVLCVIKYIVWFNWTWKDST